MTTATASPKIEPFSADFMSLEEYAARTGVSLALCYQLARADKLLVPVTRQGRRFLIPRRAYERVLTGETASAGEAA